jgi:hypothetical protein
MGVLISRESHQSDGMGGETVTRTQLYANAAASRCYYRTVLKGGFTWMDVVGQAGGPGLDVSQSVFFLFKQSDWPNGWPDVRENDIITDDQGDWIVHHVRTYQYTLQCDAEMVKLWA